MTKDRFSELEESSFKESARIVKEMQLTETICYFAWIAILAFILLVLLG